MTRIRIESKINSGGCGEVYRGVIVIDGRTVAVKKLLMPYLDEDKKRFGREVRIMEKLSHTNIMPILYKNLESDPPLFVMPLADCNLGDILQDLRQNENRRNFFYQQILDGIQYAHNSGVIHRDLKPQNILVFKGDRAVISDFGLGKFLTRDTTTLTMRGDPIGTIAYSSPEQLDDFRNADERSDIYALGKILYQMLTDRPVFPIINLTGLEGKYVYIIQKCVENDPNKRYQTINELMADFQLLTQKEFNIHAPTQIAQQLISKLVGLPPKPIDGISLEKSTKVFIDNYDDKALYMDVFPYLPDELLIQLIEKQENSFLSMFSIYDEYVSEELRFEYCDVVANFYLRIFNDTDNFSCKRIVLNRLLIMGFTHNRYYVRDVLARIIERVKDIGIAKLVLDVLRNNPDAAIWTTEAVDLDKVHPLIREGIRELNKPIQNETEIEF